MQWRRAETTDIPVIRALWFRAEYGFPFPELTSEKLISSWVAEQDGQIVCWAGAMLVPEIIAIMDPSFGSPHQRMDVFEGFHGRVAEDVISKGHPRAFCTVDPKYPTFASRLLKSGLGWFRHWTTLWITREAFVKKNDDTRLR
jgi:hypothetical protein